MSSPQDLCRQVPPGPPDASRRFRFRRGGGSELHEGFQHFRLYAGGVLGRVHTDLAVQVLIELLPQEEDLDQQSYLAQALFGHFSTEGNEVARKVLLDDPDLHTLRDELVTACTLMGQDIPELDQWRKEAQEEKRRKPFIYGGAGSSPPRARTPAVPRPLTPVQRVEKKVGRNDPCPCGSGKKFKKCCMNRTGQF